MALQINNGYSTGCVWHSGLGWFGNLWIERARQLGVLGLDYSLAPALQVDMAVVSGLLCSH